MILRDMITLKPRLLEAIVTFWIARSQFNVITFSYTNVRVLPSTKISALQMDTLSNSIFWIP